MTKGGTEDAAMPNNRTRIDGRNIQDSGLKRDPRMCVARFKRGNYLGAILSREEFSVKKKIAYWLLTGAFY